MELKEWDVAIIGGGPAGLSAAIYATRADLKTVLLERGATGGLAATTELIENYPGFAEGIGGPELTRQMESQARRFGTVIEYADVELLEWNDGKFNIKTGEGGYAAKALILATGAQPNVLNVKGERELRGRGVSYCATCDGAFFRQKKVAVVGGGDAAVEEAMFLTKFTDKVYIVHRRGELRATKVVQQRAMENPKIEFVWHSIVDEILGDQQVEGLSVKDVRSGKGKILKVEGVFVYVGLKPVSNLVEELVELDEKGYVITDDRMRTSCPGLLAAGDVRKKSLRQVVTAVSDGAVAAVEAEKYLHKN